METTPPPSNKSGATLSAADGAEGDRDHEDEEDFDDSFDVSRPPTNWNEAHATSMNMTDVIPQPEFVRNTRARESARDTSVEEKWEQENVVLQTEGSANGTPDISAFLRSVHIPKDHRAHVFVPLSHFKFLRTMATYWGMYSELFLAEDPEPKSNQPEQNWEQVLTKDDYMSKSFFAPKKTELTLRGYITLAGIADVLGFPENVLSGHVEVPAGFPNMSCGQMFDRIHRMFPGEEALREEDDRKDWNPIVNSGDERKDENQRNMGVARYSTTNRFLMETLETGRNVEIAQRRAYLDVWIGVLVGSMNVDFNGEVPTFIPRTGGRFLLTGQDCEVQVGHNDFPVIQQARCPGYFIIVTGPERVNLWVAPGSHQYVHYNEKDREQLGKTLKMERITIPPTSVFVGHGHLQHAGDGYNGSHCLRYHTYLAPDGVRIPDAILFAYRVAFGRSTTTQVSSTLHSASATNQPKQSTPIYPRRSNQGRSTKDVVSNTGQNSDLDDNNDDDLGDDFTITAIEDA